MSVRDMIVLAAVIGTFALLVTAHVWIVVGLLWRRPRWRAPIALFAFPLAPYWAVREQMTVRGIAWIAGAVGYLVARALALR